MVKDELFGPVEQAMVSLTLVVNANCAEAVHDGLTGLAAKLRQR